MLELLCPQSTEELARLARLREKNLAQWRAMNKTDHILTYPIDQVLDSIVQELGIGILP